MSATILRAASSSNLGRRQVNQDRVHVDQEHGVFIVADGMGGHRGGATAAEMAVTAVSNSTVNDSPGLIRAVEAANRTIFERSRTDPDLQGMGTTVTAMAVVVTDGEERLSIANVGDSRAYRMRAGELELLTQDHNIVSELVRDGHLSVVDARTHRQRSVLTRAVGVEPSVVVDVIEVLPAEGDRYLLCSDGLTGEVDNAQIAGILRRYADPAEACRDLIRVALDAGSKDNISAVVIDVVHDDQPAVPDAGPTGLSADRPLAGRRAPDDTLVLSRPSSGTDRVADIDQPIGSNAASTRPRARSVNRLVSARTIAFLAALAAVGAVAYWAVTNAPSDTPVTTTSTSTPPSSTSSPAPSSGTGSGSTLVLPSTAVGAPTTVIVSFPDDPVIAEPIPIASSSIVRTLPVSSVTPTTRPSPSVASTRPSPTTPPTTR